MDLTPLEEENKHLREIIEVKSELVSISAHQLRTSLSAIKWILKMFIDKDFGPLNAEQESYMEKAFESNERMIAYVNEMLRINHAENGVETEQSVSFDIVPLMEEVMFDFSGESFKKGIEIILQKPVMLIPPIVSPKEKIRIVFQNIIENAIKYSNRGDKVTIGVREKDSLLEISVTDQGIGIPEGEQSRIFEKFYRADNAKKKESIGSGLGLYTIKKIVTNIGGGISFVSAPGNTIFTITLPLRAK